MLQENTNLQNVNVLHENAVLPKPNLRKFTEAEEDELIMKFTELSTNGQESEADNVIIQLPVDPDLLNFLKDKHGIDYLIESGANLSNAVEKFGEEWLAK